MGICLRCGKEFTQDETRRKQFFCSDECRHLNRIESCKKSFLKRCDVDENYRAERNKKIAEGNKIRREKRKQEGIRQLAIAVSECDNIDDIVKLISERTTLKQKYHAKTL